MDGFGDYQYLLSQIGTAHVAKDGGLGPETRTLVSLGELTRNPE